MNIKFKKFSITTDNHNFILINKNKKKFYTDFQSLLSNIPNNLLLKSEAGNISQLINEMEEIKDILRNEVFPYIKKHPYINFEKEKDE